jgi:hypothetical protein
MQVVMVLPEALVVVERKLAALVALEPQIKDLQVVTEAELVIQEWEEVAEALEGQDQVTVVLQVAILVLG